MQILRAHGRRNHYTGLSTYSSTTTWKQCLQIASLLGKGFDLRDEQYRLRPRNTLEHAIGFIWQYSIPSTVV